MKFVVYLVISMCILLTACASHDIKQPTAAERTKEVAEIKTQLAVEYMKAKDYRQAVVSIDEALKSNSHFVDVWA